MMPLLLTGLAAIAMGAGTPGESPTPAGPPAPAPVTLAQPAKLADAGDTIVCRSEVVTGTRLSNQVCRTRDQWREQTAASKRMADDLTGANGVAMPAGK